jgi:6-phosphogluconolactonase
MSLSFATLLRTRLLLLEFHGEHKRRLLEHGLLPGTADELPVRALLQQQAAPLEVYWAP